MKKRWDWLLVLESFLLTLQPKVGVGGDEGPVAAHKHRATAAAHLHNAIY